MSSANLMRKTPMPTCDFKATLLKSHFGMSVLLYVCCIFSEHLFLRTPSGFRYFFSIQFGVHFWNFHTRVTFSCKRASIFWNGNLKNQSDVNLIGNMYLPEKSGLWDTLTMGKKNVKKKRDDLIIILEVIVSELFLVNGQ